MLNDLKRSILAAICVLALLAAAPALGAGTGHPAVLLGDTAVEWQHDSLGAGEADAFRLRAETSGLAAEVHVYMDARTSASRLIVGLYSSASGHPGTLLSTGSTFPTRGAWTSVSIAPVEILTGRTYWLAILGRGGRLRYRDRAHGRCPSATSARRDLRALSRSWRTGATYSACPVSAYVTPAAGGADLSLAPMGAAAALEQAAGTSPPGGLPEQPTGTPPAAPVALAPPVIYGETTEGKKLTASEGSWSGEPSSYVYQWQDCDKASGEACSNIGGATSSSYKLRPGDVGYRIRVAVTAANATGSAKASSEATTVVISSASAGPQVYVSQAGAGGQGGGGCGDAHSLAWLNNAGNWGAGAGRVAPGTTVDLCGVFTQPLETRGSGTNGEPITMLFTSGAKIAIGGSGCPGSGCIDIHNGSEYITIDGGGEGVIENTERSYAKEKEAGPPTTGIEARGCRHCAIENLEIGPLYVSEKGDVVGNTEIRGIESDPEGGSPEYISIENDVFHDLGWAVTVQSAESTSHIDVEHDTFYHLTHGFTPGSDFNGGDVGPIVFAHNRFYGNSNWEDGEADTNHVDGVHCFGGQNKTAHYSGLYIYDNYITTEGSNTTGPIFLEGSNGGTPCSDKTSNVWIFNNVLTGNTCCGLAGAFTGEDHTYDNTLIGDGPTTEQGEKETCESWNSDTKEGRSLTVSNRTFKNNVVTSCHNLISAERSLAAPDGVEHNLWANSGTGNEVFACEHGEVETAGEDKEAFRSSEFGSWVTCMEQPETESRYVSTAKLRLTGEAQAPLGEPESGSQAIGHGKNLSSLCSQTPEAALCENINGETRPSSGAWNIGAY